MKPSPVPAGVLLLVPGLLVGCGSDSGTGTGPVRGAAAAYDDLLLEVAELADHLDAARWEELGADGTAGAVWVVVDLRALGPLVDRATDPVSTTTAGYLVLNRRLDETARRIDRIRAGAASDARPLLERLAAATASLRQQLAEELPPRLSPVIEADPAAHIPLQTERRFEGYGGELLPTDQTEPLLLVGDAQTSATCADGQGNTTGGVTVVTRDAVTDDVLSASGPTASLTLPSPTWVAFSLRGDGAVEAVSCTLSVAGTTAGVARVAFDPDAAGLLDQRIADLESGLGQLETEVRLAVASGAPATRQLFTELGHSLGGWQRTAAWHRTLLDQGGVSADEAEMARAEEERMDRAAAEAEDRATAAAADAKEQHDAALRILLDYQGLMSQVVASIGNAD